MKKKSLIILSIIPSAAGFAIGITIWLGAVLSWIYRLYLFVKDGEFKIINLFDLLPAGMLNWVLTKFGRSAYWFLEMDFSLPIVMMGLIFIIIGILCNSAAKKMQAGPSTPL